MLLARIDALLIDLFHPIQGNSYRNHEFEVRASSIPLLTTLAALPSISWLPPGRFANGTDVRNDEWPNCIRDIRDIRGWTWSGFWSLRRTSSSLVLVIEIVRIEDKEESKHDSGRGETDLNLHSWRLRVGDHGLVRAHVDEFVHPNAFSGWERKFLVFAHFKFPPSTPSVNERGDGLRRGGHFSFHQRELCVILLVL